MNRRHTVPFVTVLIVAMVVSTFQLFVIAVLAAEIIDEFGVTKWQIGMLGAANTGVGALMAPWLGRLTDRLGARNATGLVFATSGLGMIVTAAAGTYAILILGSLISGVPQGWSNAATNKLISARSSLKSSGLITGFKQSGVQLGSFIAGLSMPAIAVNFDWHVGLVGIGVATILAAGAAMWVLLPDHVVATSSHTASSRTRLPPFVFQVAVYALFVGLAAGGVGRFIPLFANEKLGFSLQGAGIVFAFQGALGIVARLMWGRATESRLPLRGSLLAMALGGAGVFVLLLLATSIGGWILWPIAALMAFTTSAWNVVAMLAVIRSVPVADAGRATGVVMMAFLGGLTISGPAVGWSIDRTGGYSEAWWGLLVLVLIGALSVSREFGAGKSTFG